MSEFERGQRVKTTQHDPGFGFGKGEEGTVVGYDTVNGNNVVVVKFDQTNPDLAETDPQTVDPKYLEAV